MDCPTRTRRQVNVFRSLPHEPGSVREARRALDPLEACLNGETLDSARLLVSELVTNSVRHADAAHAAEIRLAASASHDRVHVEVSDAGPGFEAQPSGRAGGELEDRGWGFHLLDALSDRWGAERGERMRVWFETEAAAGDED
jgi:anti-sigma regulatory factor (Ser/Thr protein kinase)